MVHICQKRVISKTQRVLKLIAVLAVTALLLIGCAESGILSTVPEQTTIKTGLSPGQTSLLHTTTFEITPSSTAPAPDVTLQYDEENIGNLDLCQRSPDSWEIVDGGASGTLTYNLSGARFVFDFYGERLEANSSYSLIYYAASEIGPINLHSNIPGALPGALIAEGISDPAGGIHLQGSVNLGMDLPYLTDANYDYVECCSEYGTNHGAKIWLVPSDCYNSTNMIIREGKWQPDRFLFETELIIYFDTNGIY